MARGMKSPSFERVHCTMVLLPVWTFAHNRTPRDGSPLSTSASGIHRYHRPIARPPCVCFDGGDGWRVDGEIILSKLLGESGSPPPAKCRRPNRLVRGTASGPRDFLGRLFPFSR